MFRWHGQARVFDGAGMQFGPVDAGPALIDERPAGRALAQAFSAGAFRIGGEGPAPVGAFETLTSGSSGVPRRIRRSAQSWTRSFAVNAQLFGIGPGLRVAVLGRLTQSLALYGGMEAVHLGAELHLLDGLRPDRQAVALRQVDLVYATPSQMRGLVEAGVDWPMLRHVVIGGAKLDAALRTALAVRAPGAVVHEFYGAAEASFITLAGPGSPVDSVGAAYPGVEIVVDALPGEVGEIWVKSPYLFACYASADTGSARWREGFLSVGEMGRLAQGHLYLAGRAGRMVTVADHNVFPEEIEQFLQGFVGVRRAAVLPVADVRRGAHLVAVLQGDAAMEAVLHRALRARLGVLLAPRQLIWLANWPDLPSGKTDLCRLAALVAG
ncbi:MAG: AMP-binding protein [Alphaproteobacteria bacterium]